MPVSPTESRAYLDAEIRRHQKVNALLQRAENIPDIGYEMIGGLQVLEYSEHTAQQQRDVLIEEARRLASERFVGMHISEEIQRTVYILKEIEKLREKIGQYSSVWNALKFDVVTSLPLAAVHWVFALFLPATAFVALRNSLTQVQHMRHNVTPEVLDAIELECNNILEKCRTVTGGFTQIQNAKEEYAYVHKLFLD